MALCYIVNMLFRDKNVSLSPDLVVENKTFSPVFQPLGQKNFTSMKVIETRDGEFARFFHE